MKQTDRILLEDVLRYGKTTADLNGRKYFIVQRGGEIVEI